MKDKNKFFDNDEKRKEARLYRSGEIFIETLSPEPGEDTVPEIIRCEVIDISPNGAQLLADSELVIGAIHTLVIDLDHRTENYRLTAEVRWVEAHSDGFLIGLYFYDSEQTGITDWQSLMTGYLN